MVFVLKNDFWMVFWEILFFFCLYSYIFYVGICEMFGMFVLFKFESFIKFLRYFLNCLDFSFFFLMVVDRRVDVWVVLCIVFGSGFKDVNFFLVLIIVFFCLLFERFFFCEYFFVVVFWNVVFKDIVFVEKEKCNYLMYR